MQHHTIVIWCTVVVALLVPSETQTANPGFRTIVTKKGLDYVNKIGISVLKGIIPTLKIPDFNGSTTVKSLGHITINYTVTNAVLKSFSFGEHTLTSGENGLTINITDMSLVLSADWSFKEEDWPYAKDSGQVGISVGDISFKMSVNVSANQSDGSLVLNAGACSFSIGSLSVVFHGGASWFYNLFQSTIEKTLKDEISKQACSLATNKTNTIGNQRASSLPVTVDIDDKVEISYALVANPNFTASRIITDHKGEFLLIAHPHLYPPFLPPPLPPVEIFNASKMLYVVVTTYVADSASFTYYKGGYMKHNITTEQLPKEMQRTSGAICLLLQNLCDKYPNMDIQVTINATQYPMLQVSPEFSVLNATGMVSLFVKNATNLELAFALTVETQADVKPFIRYNESDNQNYICGDVSNPRVNLTLAATSIGHIDVCLFQEIITALLNSKGSKFINKYTHAGFPLPIVDEIKVENISVSLGDGYILVGTDAEFNHSKYQNIKYGQETAVPIPKRAHQPHTPPYTSCSPPCRPRPFPLPEEI